MQYIVEYKNPNDVTRSSRVETSNSVRLVNETKARAKKYPGSCVLISITKISAAGKVTKERY